MTAVDDGRAPQSHHQFRGSCEVRINVRDRMIAGSPGTVMVMVMVTFSLCRRETSAMPLEDSCPYTATLCPACNEDDVDPRIIGGSFTMPKREGLDARLVVMVVRIRQSATKLGQLAPTPVVTDPAD